MGHGSIIAVAVISEVFLVLAAYVMAWFFDLSIPWNPSLRAITIGALAALPLLIGNHFLWRWTEHHPDSVYGRFSREIIVPLCQRVSVREALIIGVLSGVGEEILFRGAFNQLMIHWTTPLLALAVTSFAFACVHFIGSMDRYGGMIPLYTFVGAILWGIWYSTESLTAAATTHGLYNFFAIVWIRMASAK